MINEAIRFLTDEINKYLSIKLDIPTTDPRLVSGNISRAFEAEGSTGGESLANKAIISLINIEEDRISKRQLPYVKTDKRIVYKNTAVHLNLYLMFAINLPNYMESLQLLKYNVQFFQQQFVFTLEQYPARATENLISK